MKIILATPIYPPEAGGPATYTVEIAKRLAPHHRVTVVAYSDNGPDIEGVKVVRIQKSQLLPLRLFAFVRALIREAKDADVIYVQNAVASGLPAVLAGKVLQKPVILKFVGDEAWERATQKGATRKNIHDFLRAPEGGLRTRLMMFLQGFVLRRATLVTTPSAYLLDEVRAMYRIKPSRMCANYNAVENFQITNTPRVPHQIASISRLVAWKHVDDIIRAIKIVSESYPDVSLKIAGDGPEKSKLEALTLSLGIQKNVSFLGNISHEKVTKLFHESSLYILNSTYEGLPHTVLESFSAKTPVIATNIPGTNELVSRETGFPILQNDDHALTEAITTVFQNPEEARHRAETAYSLVQRNFSWKMHVETLEDFFARVTRVL